MATNPYYELVEQIITKQATVLGLPVAIRRARNVAGLEIDDAGKVTAMPANAIPILEGIVEQYKALSGSMGVEFCKQASAVTRQAHADLLLPTILS
ncbi:MAG: hypothetical protein JWM56_631 [Candidatus Peribacteria bacterium]|nr:hypothetical protein [Candidatus Peribacteria bacterium]